MVPHSMEAQWTTPFRWALSPRRVRPVPSKLTGSVTLQAQAQAESLGYSHAPSLRVHDRCMLKLTESDLQHRWSNSKSVGSSTSRESAALSGHLGMPAASPTQGSPQPDSWAVVFRVSHCGVVHDQRRLRGARSARGWGGGRLRPFGGRSNRMSRCVQLTLAGSLPTTAGPHGLVTILIRQL
jgi:hypothetical protein